MNFFDRPLIKKIASAYLSSLAKKKLGYDPNVVIDNLELSWIDGAGGTLNLTLSARANIDAQSIIKLLSGKEKSE